MRRSPLIILLLSILAPIVLVNPLWATTYAYIPSYDNNLLVRVNTSSGSFSSVNFLAPEGAVSCGPYGAAVMPDGSYVLVTCYDDDSLAVIDADTFTTVFRDSGTTGSDPRGVAIDPTGTYAYVANFGDGTVSVFNIQPPAPRDEVSVGQGPSGIAAVTMPGISADTTKVYVANYDDGTVSVLTDDGSTVTTTTISSVGVNPVGVAASPDGQYVYVANSGGSAGTVAEIPTSTDAVTQRITVGAGAWGVAVGALGDYVYVTNSTAGTVSVIRISDYTVIGTYTVSDQSYGIAAAKNGDFAYAVTLSTDAPITRLDITDASVDTTDIDQDDDHLIQAPYALGAFIGGTPPTAPSDLSAEIITYGAVALTWTDNSASDELGFKIERRIQGETAFEEVARVGADIEAYTDDSDVVANTTYDYRIRAYNEAADSDYAALSGEEGITTTADSDFSWCFIGVLLQ